jgi:hypothetical protein
MRDTNRAIATLKAIEQLWEELRRTKVNTSEHEMLVKKIRARSAEYQALVDSQEPEKSK